MDNSRNIAYFHDITAFMKALKSVTPRSNLFHIQRHEEVPVSHSEETELFRTNTFSVSLLTEGEALYKIGMREYHMRPGSFYFMSPQQLRYYKKIKPWKGFVFVFSEEFIQLFSSSSVYSEYPFLKLGSNVLLQLNSQQIDELVPLMEAMYRHYYSNHDDRFKFIYHYMSLALLLGKIWHAQQHPALEENGKPVLLSSRFDDLLERHFFELVTHQVEKLFTVSDFAGKLNVSTNYLSDMVRKETGKTPTQIIKERTILEAKSLLRNTTLSVSEVADFLTFEDPSYFAKYFKGSTGLSPSEFRAGNRNQ